MRNTHIIISSLVLGCFISGTAFAAGVLPPQPNVRYKVDFRNATASTINTYYHGDGCAAGHSSVAPGQTQLTSVDCAFRAPGGDFTLTDQLGHLVGFIQSSGAGCTGSSTHLPYQIKLSSGDGRDCIVAISSN